MKSKADRLARGGVMLTVLLMGWTTAVGANQQSDDTRDIHLRAHLTELNDSGVAGTAVINVSDDGLVVRLHADHLVPGHAYTVWLFYLEGTDVGGPGRIDSAVADDDDMTFRGRVRGLDVTSGATLKFVIFDHPDLGLTNVTRADNLLTPNGGHPVAQALFEMP
jgi:hypothetical protein